MKKKKSMLNLSLSLLIYIIFNIKLVFILTLVIIFYYNYIIFRNKINKLLIKKGPVYSSLLNSSEHNQTDAFLLFEKKGEAGDITFVPSVTPDASKKEVVQDFSGGAGGSLVINTEKENRGLNQQEYYQQSYHTKTLFGTQP